MEKILGRIMRIKKGMKYIQRGGTFRTGEGFLALFSFFIFVGLLIAANPYLAVKVYPDNQNIWQDCYAITYG